MSEGSPTGVLLVNLGSPDAPRAPDVRRYLQEFLMDRRVLDIAPAARWAVVNLIIAPFRAPKSAKAYQKIWTKEGSPLIIHSRHLTTGLSQRLGPDGYVVMLAMRYGRPSIPTGLEGLRAAGCDRLIIVPLYPQYAASSTGTAVEAVYRAAASRWNTPFLTVVPPFYDDTGFIEAFARVAESVLPDFRPEHVLFSFHGLPERHMHKSDPSGTHCPQSQGCCDAIGPNNRNCYRAQCFATARALAARLELSHGWEVAFQSRLGRDPWILPYTGHALVECAQRGVKRLAVFCPAFVADCLETLEEIGIRARKDFRAAGGDDLILVPSLNASSAWIDALEGMVRRTNASAGSPV